MKIFARVFDDELRAALEAAASKIDASVVNGGAPPESAGRGARGSDVVLAEVRDDEDLAFLQSLADQHDSSILIACAHSAPCRDQAIAEGDDWVLLPVDAGELELRLRTAVRRAERRSRPEEAAAAQRLRYQELLYDRFTGFPTLPVMMERAREILEDRGELTILYINFVWYEKIEELYGWQKLDDVLETTADALRDFYSQEHPSAENLIMVSHTGDNDFILFTNIPSDADLAEKRLSELSARLEEFLRDRIEESHGEDIASLCGIYVGSASVFNNPKIRIERLVYRALREAAQAAKSVEERERVRKVADLKATLTEGAVFMEYHPIVVADTQEIYGYEALARGVRRELRSPEVLFEVAEEANLVWELSRLLRRCAVEGMIQQLEDGQFLFLNIDPHDFKDPSFRDLDPKELGIEDPSRVVLEITERTAIKDYPRFREYLDIFRKQGFLFAVDDAGSGYAGLGSIANLNPDYIKLDISLISNIDSNFLKQHLVKTMVEFAEANGAMVVAEGVEREEEFATVRDLGVHLVQGFLFHKPQRIPPLKIPLRASEGRGAGTAGR